jgi:transposase
MNYAEREIRNKILLNLHKAGTSQKVIGEMVNLSQQRVSEIIKAEKENLPTNQKPPGYKRRLSAEQMAELPKLLEQGAEFYGFTGEYWTHQRVRQVIKEEFKLEYEKKQVGRILDLINWTRQKPQKKDAKQDPEKVERGQTEELPELKKSDSRGL